MKLLNTCAFLILTFGATAQGTLGEIIGSVVSKKTKEVIVSAKVFTESNGTIYGAKTGSDGRFRISGIPAGKYDLTVVYSGDTMVGIPADVSPDGIESVGEIAFSESTLTVQELVVEVPHLRLKSGVAPEIKFDREQINRSPAKFDPKGMIAAMTSDVRLTDDGELVFRGARKGDMIYMMDGVKMTSVMAVPSASIGSMMVFTGGLPAKYGDTTGGVVVMESIGYFDLYRAWKAAESRKP